MAHFLLIYLHVKSLKVISDTQPIAVNPDEFGVFMAEESSFPFPLEGSLHQYPSRKILDQLHRDRFTGTLGLRCREKKKKLWFFRGEVFRIQSNIVPELLGRMMVDRSWISEADLTHVLQMQRDSVASRRLIGEYVSEFYGIDADEVSVLSDQQAIFSYLQSMTWSTGEYQIVDLQFKNVPSPVVLYKDVLASLQSLFEISGSAATSSVFDRIEVWSPDSRPVELSQQPLWAVLAGCRNFGLSGIVSIRRQNKLYEIVLKYGVPLTLYEGTFGHPRQTIVVRQASDEHEKFFVEQLFTLFSFISGTVYFRSLGDVVRQTQTADEEGHLQFREETLVTRSVSPKELLLGFSKDYLKKLPVLRRWFLEIKSRALIAWKLFRGHCQRLGYRVSQELRRLKRQ